MLEIQMEYKASNEKKYNEKLNLFRESHQDGKESGNCTIKGAIL